MSAIRIRRFSYLQGAARLIQRLDRRYAQDVRLDRQKCLDRLAYFLQTGPVIFLNDGLR
jgi:hypothetical protein